MKRADKRKYHYIYKIIRLDESGKYYIGMHSTDDIDDGYFGSGTLLSRSIKKHSKDKHIKEILEFLPTREALKLREKEIVNEELLGDKRCMNLKLGGEGGGRIWSEAHREKFKASNSRGGQTAFVSGQLAEARKKSHLPEAALKRKMTNAERHGGIFGGQRFNHVGSKRSDETKAKMSSSHLSTKNNQYGKCWVTNDTVSISIQKISLDDYLSKGFRRGRKIIYTT
jgi:hypothetical protein